MATHDFPATTAAIAAGDLPTGIDAAKLADGSVSDAEFQRLDGVTSAIQTQINNIRQASAGANSAAEILSDAYTVLAADRGTAVSYLTAAVLKAVSRDGLGAFLAALTAKSSPVGADGFVISDSAAGGVEKFLTLTNLVAALKTLIATDTLAAPTDVTTNNATTSAHGLLKKLSNVSTEFMNGVGNWATPASSNVAVAAVNNAGYVAQTNNTWTRATADSEYTDVPTWHDTGSNTARLTLAATGIHEIEALVEFKWVNAAGNTNKIEQRNSACKFYLNGVAVAATLTQQGQLDLYANSGTVYAQASKTQYEQVTLMWASSFTAADYVEVFTNPSWDLIGGSDPTVTARLVAFRARRIT